MQENRRKEREKGCKTERQIERKLERKIGRLVHWRIGRQTNREYKKIGRHG
jgi:hypothetical protein